MMKLREFLSRISDAVSFGDLVFVIGAAILFHGLRLVYGLGWACISVGAILIISANIGELFAMASALIHGGKRGSTQ